MIETLISIEFELFWWFWIVILLGFFGVAAGVCHLFARWRSAGFAWRFGPIYRLKFGRPFGCFLPNLVDFECSDWIWYQFLAHFWLNLEPIVFGKSHFWLSLVLIIFWLILIEFGTNFWPIFGWIWSQFFGKSHFWLSLVLIFVGLFWLDLVPISGPFLVEFEADFWMISVGFSASFWFLFGWTWC